MKTNNNKKKERKKPKVDEDYYISGIIFLDFI